MTVHHVYRCYAADGRLLYVGCSRNVFARLAMHRVQSFWAREVRRVVAKVYPSGEVARAVERAAIRDEQPRFNVVGRWATHATWTDDQYADYLMALNSRPTTTTKAVHVSRVVAAREMASALRAAA